MNEKIMEVGVAAWIYTLPGGNHFVLESSTSFRWIKYETKHLPHPFGEISNCAVCSHKLM